MKASPAKRSSQRRRARVLAMLAAGVGLVVVGTRHAEPLVAVVGLPAEAQAAARAVSLPLQRLEWEVYDYLHGLEFARRTPLDPEVVVLGIDEASLALENSSAFPEDIEASRPLQLMDRLFPWSREVYAHLIDRLVAAGARTVVIDLMFPAASEDAPEGDVLFRECLDRHAGRVVLAADLIHREAGGGEASTVHFPYSGLISHRWPADPRIGFVTYWAEIDRVIRQAVFWWQQAPELPETVLPSFAAAALRLEGRGDHLPADGGFHPIRFGHPGDYEPVSLHELFVPSLWEQNFADGRVFAGKTVFLGHVARQQQDFHPTPIGVMAGVRIHAHVYAAAKAGEWLRPLPTWSSVVLIAAGSVLAWALVVFGGRPVLIVSLLLGGMVAGLALQLLLFNHGALVAHLSTPLLAFGSIGFFGFTYDFLLERRQKLALKRSVMRFHSPDVAEQIVEHPEFYYNIREGANRTIVILFSDIRGYTSLSEVLTAQQMVAQLNEYFERMVSIVFQRQGAVDKFIGDAMMAVWGRFRDDPRESDLVEDAVHAVDAALAMRATLAELNDGWRARGITELAIGIGLHQGDAVVGEIGSVERAELTAIGDCVNLGSRLEGATKEYGLDLLISESVCARVAHRFHCRTADLIRVKGKRQPVEVFAVLGPQSAPAPAGLPDFEQAMRAYRRGDFPAAHKLFTQAAAHGLDDALTSLFLQRCRDLITHPPTDWDGVFTMTKK